MEGLSPGDGEAAARFFCVWGDNCDICKGRDRFPEEFDAWGVDAVVVGHEDKGSHAIVSL
jgi:hypothetical protein